MSPEGWLPQPTLLLTGLTLLLSLAPPRLGMEVMAPAIINAMNGSSVKLSCTFNSCYKVENKQFSLNWTYQECSNCSEELFLQFRTKIMNKQLDRFGNRVEFTGNPAKYDVSFTLKNVQLEDEGTYNCYVLNPPDRHRGHGKISLKVLTQGQWCPAPGAPTGAGFSRRALPVPTATEPVPCVPRAPEARLDGGRDRGCLCGRLPGRGDPGADGGEVRASEKAAEAQHGRPEDGGGREDRRRRQPGRGHQVKAPCPPLPPAPCTV
uniref:Sodium voltage-gated channel beta subunit 2 n=1 Tax=Serinus canaria TaxID=9135 RepID=A0A8C9MRE4_SERCA